MAYPRVVAAATKTGDWTLDSSKKQVRQNLRGTGCGVRERVRNQESVVSG